MGFFSKKTGIFTLVIALIGASIGGTVAIQKNSQQAQAAVTATQNSQQTQTQKKPLDKTKLAALRQNLAQKNLEFREINLGLTNLKIDAAALNEALNEFNKGIENTRKEIVALRDRGEEISKEDEVAALKGWIFNKGSGRLTKVKALSRQLEENINSLKIKYAKYKSNIPDTLQSFLEPRIGEMQKSAKNIKVSIDTVGQQLR
ncbi:hypothetical protein J4440_00585 [Candidatus Woesearchaeota archaeon]|nr:hypothetical protein [Candidatus Woesearchaeota archaeon]